MAQMRDETGLDKNAANFVALTPLSHLKRASYIFPDRLAVPTARSTAKHMPSIMPA